MKHLHVFIVRGEVDGGCSTFLTSTFLFSSFPVPEKLDGMTVRRCRSSFGPIASHFPPSVFNRVVGPGLFGSGLNVASTTWLEIHGEIGILLSAVDAHLLVASSVQFNVVEHAHEDDVAWQILRRRIHHRVRDELLNPCKILPLHELSWYL